MNSQRMQLGRQLCMAQPAVAGHHLHKQGCPLTMCLLPRHIHHHLRGARDIPTVAHRAAQLAGQQGYP